MNTQIDRLNVEKILVGLKDFQRDTVEYIFRRLYLDQDYTRRLLVADEVGLGKTLVARGLIAKAVDHLWENVDRIDVVYICSNADIARQNINRLNVSSNKDFVHAARMTLLPITINDLRRNTLNLISFTPGTSFDLKSALGTTEERALIYRLLDYAWTLKGTAAFNVLQGHVMKSIHFRNLARNFEKHHNIDELLKEEFTKALKRRKDLKSRFQDLCEDFTYVRKSIPDEQAQKRSSFIGDVRRLLAVTCIRSLEPDLIILDEFQRFRNLLDPDEEMGHLARELFEYSDQTSEARVLLLSATPYKMYTITDEAGGENHYEDFLRTLRFLENSPDGRTDFESLLNEFRQGLYHLGDGGGGRLDVIKSQMETRLRRVMVRTEKLAVSENREGMLSEVPCTNSILAVDDLKTYIGLQHLARLLEQGDILEYWKSAPYLLNFMEEGYELKRICLEALEKPKLSLQVARILRNWPSMNFTWEATSSYSEVDPYNARLRGLIADTIGAGAWKLLWMPSSLPYYQPGGMFSEPALEKLTKRLVFSSWQVVPRVIAAVLSYEAERQMIRSFETNPRNSTEARKRRGPLLRFARQDDRLTGMPVLGIIYPSVALARKFDPLSFTSQDKLADELPSSTDFILHIQRQIEASLPQIMQGGAATGPVDETWYWAAPILLDLREEEIATREWFAQEDLAKAWQGEQDSAEEESKDSLWSAHVRRVNDLLEGKIQLGPPPQDLSRVLALMAIASPGVASLRALCRISGGLEKASLREVKTSAGTVGWSFLSLFNLPEAIALIRSPNPNDEEPYWKRVLGYCVDGNLQSVLDEYVHILKESEGFLQRTTEIVPKVASAVNEALSLRTSTLGMETMKIDASGKSIISESKRMRTRFALRLGGNKSDGAGEELRTDQVRKSFNSPFWPFIVATTSIGQEGLDFHHYCHAVVHWNLPSNPVDLEQREGRVHRYKCHAIRKNLALKYGLTSHRNSHSDPWEALFAIAKRERPENASDLVPYWHFPLEGGAKIERHVPALPLSRDFERLAALRRSLAVYRMVFGQPRQEDLVSYILNRVPPSELARLTRELQIDLSPPRIGRGLIPTES
jgi:Helicase conserved C-terminal domain